MKNKILIASFICMIFGIGFLHISMKDEHFSEYENRVLQPFPAFTIEDFLSGEFMNQLETYIADQFFSKKQWVGMKAKAEQVLGKQENNGIYFGEKGYLFEAYEKSAAQIEQYLAYINEFAKRVEGVETSVMLVPNAGELYSEYLPAFAPTDPQFEVLSSIEASLHPSLRFVDVYSALKQHKDEQIYFRTDHHWTMRGAYYAYVEAAEAMGFTPLTVEQFDLYRISDDFYGTHYSRANDLSIEPDYIEFFDPKKKPSVSVVYENDTVMDELYAWEYLDHKDQYRFFLDGNHPLMEINTEQKNGRKLVIVKDSYAHAFIPFLVNHYEEIHVIDLRYFRQSVSSYVNQHEISEMLYVFNLAHFTANQNLIWLR